MDFPIPTEWDPPIPRTARPIHGGFNLAVIGPDGRHWISLPMLPFGPPPPFVIVDSRGGRWAYYLTPDHLQAQLLDNEHTAKLAALLYALNYQTEIVVVQGQLANEVVG